MARKTQPDNGGTATAERKTRTRKSPKHKAESLVVKACNALDALGCMADKLTETQREGVHAALSAKLNELDEAFKAVDDDESDPEPKPFSLPD